MKDKLLERVVNMVRKGRGERRGREGGRRVGVEGAKVERSSGIANATAPHVTISHVTSANVRYANDVIMRLVTMS